MPLPLGTLFAQGPTRLIHGLPPSTVFQLDAALASSYPGSGQTWANIRERPADGSAKTAYDFWLGRDVNATTDDPTFDANKFTLDGGDYAELKTNTAFFNNQMRSDLTNAWWCVAALKYVSLNMAQTFYGNTNGSNVAGWRLDCNSSSNPTFRLTRSDGTQNVTTNLHMIGAYVGVPILHAFTWDNGTRNYKSAINSRSFTVSGTATSLPSTTSNNGKFNFGGANHGTSKLGNGCELYGMAMGVGNLTNLDLTAIVNYYNALHGRTYA